MFAIGTGADFQMTHNGTDTTLEETTGDLYIKNIFRSIECDFGVLFVWKQMDFEVLTSVVGVVVYNNK